MIGLKKFTFKQLILLLPMMMFIILAISYTVSMHYVFSNRMTEQVYFSWQNEVISISDQARFPIITESNAGILRVVNLRTNPKIKHLSIHTNTKTLYSSGKQEVCKFTSITENLFINTNNYFCFNQVVENKHDKQKIGHITLIVSKKELNQLIIKNLEYNVWIIICLTIIIFGLFYFLASKILSPLESLYLAMKKVSQKKKGVHLKKQGTMDMRYIQQEFNHMIKTIEQHETLLDKKVIDRTLELSNAYQDAKGASKVKSDILKIVSHEMKTPLTGAMLFLHLIKSGKGDYINETIDCIERLQTLIDNLLDYSRAIENKIILNKTHFSIVEFLEQIKIEFSPILSEKNNTLKLDNRCKKEIYSDKKLIKQILSNFISNANKFTLNGNISITCSIENNKLSLSVSDSGCGISEAHLKKIFDPFWQVDMSSSRSYEGTGLGLSICYLFAETLHGKINVKSKILHGSEFTLSIPVVHNDKNV